MRKTDPLPPVANRLEWLCAVFGSDLEFQESLNAACNLQLCPISAHSNRVTFLDSSDGYTFLKRPFLSLDHSSREVPARLIPTLRGCTEPGRSGRSDRGLRL
jgi:hypothetical protein